MNEVHPNFSFIVCSDLHFTSNPEDSYRFGIVPWLVEQASEYRVNDIFILGDLTEKKDHHGSSLVNTVVGLLEQIPQRVTILKGNHDYIHHDEPYFEFLNVLPNVTFLSKTTYSTKRGSCSVLFIPHGKRLDNITRHPDLICLHHTVKGAVDFTGRELDGKPFEVDDNILVLSGDVHKAQTVGQVEYIGVPYDTRFGERSTRSAIVFENGRRHDLRFPAPRKRTLRVRLASDFDRVKGKSGDFVRVVIELPPDEVGKAHETRAMVEAMAEAKGFILDGVQMQLQIERPNAAPTQLQQPEDAFATFCEAHKLSDFLVEVGRKCLLAKTS